MQKLPTIILEGVLVQNKKTVGSEFIEPIPESILQSVSEVAVILDQRFYSDHFANVLKMVRELRIRQNGDVMIAKSLAVLDIVQNIGLEIHQNNKNDFHLLMICYCV
jgi:hypothetical protein